MYDLNETYSDFGYLDTGTDAIGWLRRIEDRTGQWLAYQRDGVGRMLAIRTGADQHLRLHYSDTQPARLVSVERLGDAPQVLVRYDYDGFGQLITVTNANGEVARRFSYANGVMTSHTNALGFVAHYEWADIGGQPRVTACWSSEGERADFTYDLASRQTRVRDELGRSAHWIYDEHLQIVECTDLDGGVYRTAYNEAGLPTQIALPGERDVLFEYDDAGRIVAETDPLGRRIETGYDANSIRVRQVTLADGARWRAEYDYSRQGYTGHHINSVEGNGALGLKWQGDPRNIAFLENNRHPKSTSGAITYNEHVHSNQGHCGTTQNSTRGRLIDRKAMINRGCK